MYKKDMYCSVLCKKKKKNIEISYTNILLTFGFKCHFCH